jgi:diamine N-acetyltransferase
VLLELRPVERDHVRPLIGLRLAEGQEGQVADNATTLAQAAYETGSQVWGLWVGEEPVGLVAMIDMRAYPWVEPADDPESAYLWRLLIDARQQGRGYGQAAVAGAVEVARGWAVPRLTASVVDRPGGAMGFYERLGFRRTGRLLDGEVVIELDLGDQA